MTDEKIRAVLRRAAEERAFHDALMADREATLDTLGLTPAEKAILMAPEREQLEKMIAARRLTLSGLGRAAAVGGLAVGGLGAAAVLGLGLFATTGATREVHYEHRARSTLKQIAYAQDLYMREHGAYGDVANLVKAGTLPAGWAGREMSPDTPYEFELVVEGDAFTVTARHRTRPDTRRAFRVGPDGEVKPLENGER